MKNSFHINEYVKNRLKAEGIYTEEDKEGQENFRKQVKNLLKLFQYNPEFKFFNKEKGNHIFNCFPLDNLNDKDTITFLNYIFDLKQQVDGKIVANINKIHIDSKSEYEGNEYRDFDYFYINKEENSRFEYFLSNEKIKNRKLIRYKFDVQGIEENITNFLIDLNRECLYKNLFIAANYIEDALLQILNYWVISVTDIDYDDKLEMTQNIEMLFYDFDTEINNYILRKDSEKTLDLDEALGIYTSLLTTRNSFGQYLDILNTLKEEAEEEKELFKNPEEKFKVNKNIKVKDIENPKLIITEGLDVYDYEEKLLKTKDMINVFSNYGFRNASIDNILDLKVYFREFYISDVKYKRQAQTIINIYINSYKKNGSINNFEKLSEYKFIREKISRGYFRETTGLNLFNKKNRLQVMLYELILKIFLTYDYKVIFELLYKLSLSFIRTVYTDLISISQEKF